MSGLRPPTQPRFPIDLRSGVLLNVALLVLAACDTGNRVVIAPAVSLSPASQWPNEPAQLTLQTDWGLDVAPAGRPQPWVQAESPIGTTGWRITWDEPIGPVVTADASLGSDNTAPVSPPSIYDFSYPKDMVEGWAPATVFYSFSPMLTEIYVGFRWKPSLPFDLGPNGNKLGFIFNQGGGAGGQQYMDWDPGAPTPNTLRVTAEYPPPVNTTNYYCNRTCTVPTQGDWHLVEWYYNTNGTLRWWLDGVLQGDISGVVNTFQIDMFQFSPTWGGNSGAKKLETDHYWYDHVHISGR